MIQEKLRIIFMGTPDFAVQSLDILVQNKYDIVAVVTAPDKPAGRGQQVQISAVKKYALANNLKILQPDRLKSEHFINELQSLNANLFIVVAFRMLPEIVWKMPKYGTFNLHASLLPQYRGAAPINWAIINGETQTGVTTFFLQHEIDTGNIILQEKIEILPTDNLENVHDNLMFVGANLVLKTTIAIESGNIVQKSQISNFQSNIELKHAPKIFKQDCLIDWNKSSVEIHNKIRGLSPFPTAYTFINGKQLKIFNTVIFLENNDTTIANGNFETDGKTTLKFKTNDGWLHILDLQLEGKKRMKIDEFLRGFRF